MVRTLADLVTKSPESEVLGVLEAERETINALTNAGGEKGRWRYFSFTNLCTYQTGSPGGSGESTHLPVQKARGRSPGREDPWRRKRQPTPALLPGASHGRRSLAGYSSWGHTELVMT